MAECVTERQIFKLVEIKVLKLFFLNPKFMSSRALCSYAPADEMDNTYLEAVGIQEDDINHIVIARLSQTVIVHQR